MYIFFTLKSYRNFEVNCLVLRQNKAKLNIKISITSAVLEYCPQNRDNLYK